MTNIFIGVGQGGIQLTQQYWDLVHSEFPLSDENFFQQKKASCILVDSEPKVVRNALDHLSVFRKENVFFDQSGRGNNWAFGYYGSRQGRLGSNHLLENTLEAFRKELELCDHVTGYTLVHSVGGGTGSGLGSAIAESLREELPKLWSVSVSLLPHADGDSPLQHYNALLALHSLQQSVDGIISWSNEVLLRTIGKLMGPSEKVSLSQMNAFTALSLSTLMFPHSQGTHTIPWDMGDFVTSVVPMDTLKWVTLHSVPSKPLRGSSVGPSWRDLIGHLSTILPKGGIPIEPPSIYGKRLFAQVIVRGDTSQTFGKLDWPLLQRALARGGWVPWAPFSCDLRSYSSVLCRSVPRSIVVASNQFPTYLPTLLRQAKLKYEAKGFLHWFLRYGCELSQFEEAFQSLQNTITEYTDHSI